MSIRLLSVLFLLSIINTYSFAQKVLQLEYIGKVKTTKIYLGETIFLKTKQDPDAWFEAILEDVNLEAPAVVFGTRIVLLKDIIAIKRRKKSGFYGAGSAMQYAAAIPISYEIIYGLVNPPIEWKSLAIFAGGSVLLGTLLKLIPPKKYKMGKKHRLRVLDLTFYAPDTTTF